MPSMSSEVGEILSMFIYSWQILLLPAEATFTITTAVVQVFFTSIAALLLLYPCPLHGACETTKTQRTANNTCQ